MANQGRLDIGKQTNRCKGNAGGLSCRALGDLPDLVMGEGGVSEDATQLDQCVQYCKQEIGAQSVAAAEIDTFAGKCCCQDVLGCSCFFEGLFPNRFDMAMLNAHTFPTVKCPASLVTGGYINQCRTFQSFTPKLLEVCYEFLDEDTTYTLQDTAWLDANPNSFLQNVVGAITPVMADTQCLNNFKGLLCSSFFKECRPVQDANTLETLYLPALMCRSECENRTAVWNECVADIQGTDREAFDAALAAVVVSSGGAAERFFKKEIRGDTSTWAPFHLLPCDVTGGNLDDIPDGDEISAFLLGQYPPSESVMGVLAIDFPPNVDGAALYPEEFSTYTTAEGEMYDVQCFISGEEPEAAAFVCPAPFLSPIEAQTSANCVKACPVPAYTIEEYDLMWVAYSIPSTVGLALNLFMCATWVLGGKRSFNSQPFPIKLCVIGGLIYGCIDTIPVLALKHDLPCSNETEEGIGSSAICAINRSSRYILLAIMFSLASLTYSLFATITLKMQGSRLKAIKDKLNILSVGVPFIFCIAAYALDTNDVDNENSVLNISRNAFNCSMRFTTMATEWAVLWAPTVFAGIAIIVFAAASWVAINKEEYQVSAVNSARQVVKGKKGSPANHQLKASKRRLLQIAVMASICVLANCIVTVLTSSTLEEWSRSADVWLQCTVFESHYAKDWDAYQFQKGQSVCTAEATTFVQGGNPCMQDCKYEEVQNRDGSLRDDLSPLVCMITEDAFDVVTSAPLVDYAYCDCSCDAMVRQDRPSVGIVVVSFLAQAMVVTITGLNLGFTEKNVAVWRRFGKKKHMSPTGSSSSLSGTGSPSQSSVGGGKY